jgi:hypothetical protein
MTDVKAFKTFTRISSPFRSERLTANIKLTLHKALIRSVMNNVYPAWELEGDVYLLKLLRLQRKFSSSIEHFQGTHQSTICTRFSTFRTYTITLSKLCKEQSRLYKITRMNKFAVHDKIKSGIQNIGS